MPLLIMPPAGRGLSCNISVNTLTDLADLYPTILAMAGVRPPVPVSGLNLLEPLREERIFFGDSLHKNFCVMEKGVKLVYSAAGGQSLLFDLSEDPMEQHDLSNVPDRGEQRKRLWMLLLEHTRQYSPEILTPEGTFHTTEAPRFPGDVPGRWFGFHYHDYSIDTFH